MAKRKRAGLVKLNNLPMLQNLIRRDPPSYREEFIRQYDHYETQRAIFLSDPASTNSDPFAELVGFMAQVTSCYPDLTASFPDDLAQLLLKNHAALDPDLREKLVQGLVLLRNKDAITSTTLLKTLFPILTATQSKQLRSQIYRIVISDMKNSNAKARNHKLNKAVQAQLFELVELGKDDTAATTGLWAVKVTRELWKRNVWDDARTVEIMKEASLSANAKVMAGGVRFFLGVDQDKEDNEDSEDEGPDIGKLKHQILINKKTKSSKRMLAAAEKMRRKARNKNKPNPLNFSALHLLHDPQGFADTLFSKHLARSNTKLTMEQKLMVLQLVSRLVGLHKLSVLSVYSYLLKYLTPRQRDVTHFLICAAQAAHDQVPPDALEPITRKIADEFVSEGVAGEVATAGLNSIREICARAPLAMNTALLQDLTEYKGSKDKGVMMAARSLIGLYREVAPEMLKRRDRGKAVSIEMKDRQGGIRFGEEKSGVIEGLDLLERWKEEQKALKRVAKGGVDEDGDDDGDGNSDGDGNGDDNDDDWEDEDEDEDEDVEDEWANWEVESDASNDGTGWINVDSDSANEFEISDSEDENTKNKKAKTKTAENEEQEQEDFMEPVDQKVEAEELRLSKLATTKILTPADLAKLEELKAEAGLLKLMGKNKNEDAVDERALGGGVKRGKSDKEARIAAAMEGRADREKFGSKRGEKLKEKPHSTTNKEKARKKNFLMTLRKAKSGQKRKLMDVQKVMKSKQQGHKRKRK